MSVPNPQQAAAPASPIVGRAELDPIWDVDAVDAPAPLHKKRILLLAAMPEEALPVLSGHEATRLESPAGPSWRIDFPADGAPGAEVTLVTCGIGLVNAAAAAVKGIALYQPDLIISLGSAGGLAPQIRRGDIVVGTRYRYGDADSTAFGYQYGQIPGMPACFDGDQRLIDLIFGEHDDPSLHCGEILSANSFVTGELAGLLQQRFPEALATDMESAAIAQVAFSHEVGFVCVRSISDLCGDDAAQEWDDSIGTVAARSAQAVWNLIQLLASSPDLTQPAAQH